MASEDHMASRDLTPAGGVKPSREAEPSGAWLDLAESGPGTPGCRNADCGLFPHYGVAPHECFYKKGPGFTIGQSTLLPREEWPRHFVLDLEPGEDPKTIAYPGACGVFYCPECLGGHPGEQP